MRRQCLFYVRDVPIVQKSAIRIVRKQPIKSSVFTRNIDVPRKHARNHVGVNAISAVTTAILDPLAIRRGESFLPSKLRTEFPVRIVVPYYPSSWIRLAPHVCRGR